MPEEGMDPRFTAGLDLVQRCGALAVQVRWSDDEDPTVWFVVARFNVDPGDRHPRPADQPGVTVWRTAAALHVLRRR